MTPETIAKITAVSLAGMCVVTFVTMSNFKKTKKKLAESDYHVNMLLDALAGDEAAIDYAGYAIPRR